MRLTRTLLPALLLAPLAVLHAADARKPASKPNILLILADDLGYGDVRCYNDQSKVATPHLDRLAREGMRFTDAHSPATVCTPSRYSLMTGQMAFRVPRGGTVFTGVGGSSLIETRPGPNDVRLFASANHHANFVDAAKGRTQPASLWMLSTFLCGFAAPAPDPLGWRLGVAAWSFNHASQPIESIDTNHPKGHIP